MNGVNQQREVTTVLTFKDAGWERGFYWYVPAMIAMSLIVYIWMNDTKTAAL